MMIKSRQWLLAHLTSGAKTKMQYWRFAMPIVRMISMISIQDFGFAKRLWVPNFMESAAVVAAYASMNRGCDVLHTDSEAHVQAIVDFHPYAIVGFMPRRNGWVIRKRGYGV